MNPEWLRYYLAAKLNGRVEDVAFNPDDFVARVNSDLVGKLVNIASRCAGFIGKRFDGALAAPDPGTLSSFANGWSGADSVASLYEAREFGKAMREIMAFADRVNEFIDAEKPWELAKDPAQAGRLHQVCSDALRAFRDLVILLAPVLPVTTAKAAEFLGIEVNRWSELEAPLPEGHRIKPFKHLLQRVDPKQLDALFDYGHEASPAAGAGDPVDASGQISIDDFARVALRVARIESAERVEGSAKLLRLTLDVGEARPRQVFAGIAAHYDPAKLVGKLTVMVANLAPRKMKFGVSEGMVLAASSSNDGGGIFLVEPHAGATPGMVVR
jgi:methionyl-tRNA synthetase